MSEEKTAFEIAAQERQKGLVWEFVYFLHQNKKWWLLPILLTIAFLAVLCFFASTGAAPFIYTVF